MINQATKGGVNAEPSLAQQSKQAEQKVLSLIGVQTETTRALAGKPGASVNPRRIRTMKKLVKVEQAPVNIVIMPQPAEALVIAHLGPNLLINPPTGNMIRVYDQKNAEPISPIWAAVRLNSSIMVGTATLKFVLSR